MAKLSGRRAFGSFHRRPLFIRNSETVMLATSHSRRIAAIVTATTLAALCLWQTWVVAILVLLMTIAGGAVVVAFVIDWIGQGDEDLDAERREQNAAKARQ